MKKELSDNESISQEVVGNAHIENYALKLFLYADNEDRAGRFHKWEPSHSLRECVCVCALTSRTLKLALACNHNIPEECNGPA